MVTDDPGKPIDVPDPTDENPTIPAGYTYFGQFIDHDITFDPTPLAARQVDVAALQDFRTPALDLDCVYGRGPDDQPFMYKEDGLQLREGVPLTPTGAPVATKNDVPRLKIDGQFTQPAILGDKRNDENRLVAQLHSVFIAFHNKVVNDPDLVAAGDGVLADGTSRFRGAVNIVRWHYQWLVLNDFLPKVLYPGVLHHILNPDGAPRLDHYEKPAATYAYIPVEFAGAAYRFGHSMVRPSYALNLNVGTGSNSPSLGGGPGQPRIPIFSAPDQGISEQEDSRRQPERPRRPDAERSGH